MRFGLFQWFFSIAPNDKDCPTAIRLCFSTTAKDAFPATVDDSFFDSLRKGEEHEGEVQEAIRLRRGC